MNEREARMRVFQLYKAWTRQIPEAIEQHTLPVTLKEAQETLKKHFMKNAHVKDIRVIDMLIIKVVVLHIFSDATGFNISGLGFC